MFVVEFGSCGERLGSRPGLWKGGGLVSNWVKVGKARWTMVRGIADGWCRVAVGGGQVIRRCFQKWKGRGRVEEDCWVSG